jgi:RNA polymerase sigma factor (sigma-70 family)
MTTISRPKQRIKAKGDTWRHYLKTLGQVDLLTPEEEVLLSYQIQKGMEIENARAELESELGRKPTAYEWAHVVGVDSIEDIKKQLQKSSKARSAMINANLRLVVSICRAYQSRGLIFQDLVQEGTVGLMRAAEKFDPAKGFKFSTYATWWVKQAIMRAIADQSRSIRLPVHVHDSIISIRKAQRDLSSELKREATEEEIAERTKIPAHKLNFYLSCQDDSISMETTKLIGTKTSSANSKKEVTLNEMVTDNRHSPEDSQTKIMLKDNIGKLIDTLSPREQDVVRMRFGLEDGQVRTLEEIGQIFSVTRERVRQIEARALHKLRQPYRNHKLKEHIGCMDIMEEVRSC